LSRAWGCAKGGGVASGCPKVRVRAPRTQRGPALSVERAEGCDLPQRRRRAGSTPLRCSTPPTLPPRSREGGEPSRRSRRRPRRAAPYGIGQSWLFSKQLTCRIPDHRFMAEKSTLSAAGFSLSRARHDTDVMAFCPRPTGDTSVCMETACAVCRQFNATHVERKRRRQRTSRPRTRTARTRRGRSGRCEADRSRRASGRRRT
jgi:hypothetical protein